MDVGTGSKSSAAVRVGGENKDATAKPVVLTEVLESAISEWRQAGAPWTKLLWHPEAERTPPVLCEATFRQGLIRALQEIEAGNRRRGEERRLWIHSGTSRTGVICEFVAPERRYSWRLRTSPRWGGAPGANVRGRVVFPASGWRASSSKREAGFGDAVCLLFQRPSTAELVRSLIDLLPVADVWQTRSWREARQWVVQHPRCPLVVGECVLAGDAEPELRLWPRDQAFDPTDRVIRFPVNRSKLLVAARNIFLSESARKS